MITGTGTTITTATIIITIMATITATVITTTTISTITATATTITSTAEARPAAAAALLHLMRLASPSLPVGGFSYSEGLEAAVDAGQVRDEAGALRWLESQFELVLARAELPLVAQAHAAWSAFDEARMHALHAWHHDTRESAELRAQAEQMGRSLCTWLRNSPWQHDARLAALEALAPAPGWPLAFALAAALANASREETALAFAFSWAENLVQAAVKCVPLGQAGGQRVLQGLIERIPAAVQAALVRSDDERQAFAPMLAILSAQHEGQYSRLFRS
jgi:urease accessory protein